MEWGIYLREPSWSVEKLRSFVEEVESLGIYHGIYTNDHLTGFDDKINGKEPYLDAWTFITAVLMWSRKIHGGHTVLCQSFRNPAILAKMTASIDFLSKGRFELLLGTGWKEDEYLAYGYPFPPPSVRLRQLEETVTIIKALLNPNIEEWDFKGEFWTLKDNRNFPKPSNPIPIHLGGSKPRFLKMAARIADGFNTGLNFKDSIRVYHKFDEEVQNLGKNPSDIIKSAFGGMYIFKTENEVFTHAKDLITNNQRFSDKNPSDLVQEMPWGTPETLAEKLKEFIESTGVYKFISHFQCSFADPLSTFKDEVLPLL